MKNPYPTRILQFLHWLHYLATPFLLASIYFLTYSFLIDATAERNTMIGNGFILLGFGLGLYTLRNPEKPSPVKPRHQHLVIMVYPFLGCLLLLLGVVIFFIKKAGVSDPIGLGLCSCVVGLFAMAKENHELLGNNPGSSESN